MYYKKPGRNAQQQRDFLLREEDYSALEKSLFFQLRGFRITGINEEMTPKMTTVIIISNPETQVFFEILLRLNIC